MRLHNQRTRRTPAHEDTSWRILAPRWLCNLVGGCAENFNATETKRTKHKALRGMWEGNGSKAERKWQVRDGVFDKTLLFSQVCCIGSQAFASDKGHCQETRSAGSVIQWRVMCRLRCNEQAARSPSYGLLETRGCNSPVSAMPPQTRHSGRQARHSSQGKLLRVWSRVSAQQTAQQPTLQITGMPQGDGQAIRAKAMGEVASRADQLRCAGNQVVAIQGAVAFVELVRRVKSER